MKIRGWLALSALTITIMLAGCSRADPSMIADSTGAGSDTPAGAGPATVEIAADASGQLKFADETLSGPADQPITVSFSNPAAVPHNWVLVEPGQEQAVATAAQAANGNPAGIEGVIAGGAPITSATEPIQVPPTPAGEYPYLCTVPGHYQAGMAGTMTLGAAAATGEPTDADVQGAASAAASSAAQGAAGSAVAGGNADGITVAADPSGQLKFQQTTLQAKSGTDFTVNFSNPAPVPHNWVLVQPGQENAVATAAAAKGGDPSGIEGVIVGGQPIANSSETVTVPAQSPGTYPYICTVPGHYQAGMKGELAVTP